VVEFDAAEIAQFDNERATGLVSGAVSH